MRQSFVSIAVAGLLSISAAFGADSRTLTGSFDSGYQDRPERLRAVFTPTGDGEWSVIFHFRFNGAEYAYRGTAAGSLSSGALEGRAENRSGTRTFTFRGEFEDGNFKGTHFEIRRGKESRTGTLRLAG